MLVAAVAGGCSVTPGSAPLSLTIAVSKVSPAEYAFVPATIDAPPRSAVAVTLINDSDAPHTLVMLEPIDRRTDVIVAPGARDELRLTTPGPGSYRFVCTVHENMAGTLLIEAQPAAP